MLARRRAATARADCARQFQSVAARNRAIFFDAMSEKRLEARGHKARANGGAGRPRQHHGVGAARKTQGDVEMSGVQARHQRGLRRQSAAGPRVRFVNRAEIFQNRQTPARAQQQMRAPGKLSRSATNAGSEATNPSIEAE